MTPQQLAAFIAESKAICDRATPGPWERQGPFEKSRSDHGWRGIAGSTMVMVGRDKMKPYPQAENDAAFLIHARTALPTALAELERLQHELIDANLKSEVMHRMNGEIIAKAEKIVNEIPAVCKPA
jgi:hypothetical protein